MHSHFRETHTKILHFWKKPPPNPKVPSTLEDQNFSMIETNMYYYVDTLWFNAVWMEHATVRNYDKLKKEHIFTISLLSKLAV